MYFQTLEELTLDDLKSLLGVATERKRLEFKSELPGGEDQKGEFLKDLSALANTGGGDIVYGIAEDKATKTAAALVPFDNGLVELEITRLHQILQSGVRPRIPGVQMHTIEVEPGKSALVIRVPQSHIGPHQIIFRQSFRFYGRNTNGTYHVEVEELRDMILRQASLPEQMRAFRQSRLDLIRIHPEDMPTPVEFDRKLVVHYMPEQTFGRIASVDANQFTEARHRNPMLQGVGPTYAQVGLSYRSNIDGYVFMNGRSDDALQFYVQVFSDGTIEFVDGAVFRTSADEPVIYHTTLEETLFRQYAFAGALLASLGVADRVAIYASALGIRDLTIKPQARTRTLDFVGHRTVIGRDPALFNPLYIDKMAASEADQALEPLIQQFWRASAYDRAYSYKDGQYVGKNW
jgi:hypothetical protein